jgi:hypothetical protein
MSPEKQLQLRVDLIDSANAKLLARDACCRDFKDATISGSWPTSLAHVAFDDSRDVGTFEGSKTYFVGMELPSNLASRKLLIKEWYVIRQRDPHASATILDSLPGPDSTYVLKPYLAFLDSDRNLISTHDMPICYDQGWDGARTGFFSGIAAPESARYAILFTRPQRLDSGIHHQYSGGGGTVGFSFQYSGTMKIYFGPTGNIEMGIINDVQLESLRGSRDPECADVLAAWGG